MEATIPRNGGFILTMPVDDTARIKIWLHSYEIHVYRERRQDKPSRDTHKEPVEPGWYRELQYSSRGFPMTHSQWVDAMHNAFYNDQLAERIADFMESVSDTTIQVKLPSVVWPEALVETT